MSGTAFVTGGASGIGLATARTLRDQGWNVVIADLDGSALRRVGREVDGVRAVALDVTDAPAVAAAVGAAEAEFGAVDALVNCAGVVENAPFLTAAPETFRRTLEVNLTGTFLVGQAVARGMAARGRGSIVNIASVSGLRGGPYRAAYGASKGGVIALTKVMAVELGPCGVRVNCVAPGATDTPLVRVAQPPAIRRAVLRSIPLGRYADPAETAAVIAFLAGDGAAFVTGQIWGVDGGQLAGAGWRPEPNEERPG
ncbi:oxidoreductase [Actinomadura sp. NBRC 104425]|uniref:SDR family NAD(P)-dependent oxidoreductase n=1 Tax=Actinomadura sp. NBRC 104425 TaxID=3032204 RepID=UPI0024A2E146|nr:SDR family NAD(P)-dependent oxidoreductase [Actinomadura sp. NBRC 104425]GLZ14320.1 oxidoreductase [Actinomadura sp. NBRC 104425]